MGNAQFDTHKAIVEAVDLAVNRGALPRWKARRIKMMCRWPMFCEVICARVESILIDEGILDEDLVQLDPENWDWDKILERLMTLMEFIFKLVMMLIDVLA